MQDQAAFRFVRNATSGVIWWNFAHLFMIALVPVATAWMAASRLAAAPVFVYALVFMLIEIAYIAFERVAFYQAKDSDLAPRLRQIISSAQHVQRCDRHLLLVASERVRPGLLRSPNLPKPASA
jgi:uncharacterized membrane protein